MAEDVCSTDSQAFSICSFSCSASAFFFIYHRCGTLTVFLQIQLLSVLDVKFKEARQQTLVDFIGINAAIRTLRSIIV